MRHTAVIDGHRYTWLESLKMNGELLDAAALE